MSEQDDRAKRKAAADKAIRDLFRLLGVNIEDGDEVKNLKEDLEYLRRVRRWRELGITALVWTVVVSVVSGVALAIWHGVLRLIGLSGG